MEIKEKVNENRKKTKDLRNQQRIEMLRTKITQKKNNTRKTWG